MRETLTEPGFKQLIGTATGRRKTGRRPHKRAGGGVVSFCVRRPTGKIAASDFTPSKLINVIQAGLAVHELEYLQASLAVPMERLGPMLGISKATLHRRMAGGRLRATESDRVVRFALLMGKARRGFGIRGKGPPLADLASIRVGRRCAAGLCQDGSGRARSRGLARSN